MTPEALRSARLRWGIRAGLRAMPALLLVVSLVAACGDQPILNKATGLQKVGKFKESLIPINRMLEIDPDDAGALFLKGIALNRLGRTERAITVLKRAGEAPEFRLRAGVLEAEIHLARGAPVEALEVTNLVLAVAPGVPRVVGQRARARAAAGVELEGGLEDVAKYRELRPDNVEMLQIMAVLLTKLERYEEAEQAVGITQKRWLAGDDAITNDHGLLSRWCSVRASLAVARGERDEPKGLFGYCLREYGHSKPVLTSAIEFYRAAGMKVRLEESLRSSLDLDPLDLARRLELADLFMERGATRSTTKLLIQGEKATLGEKQFEARWALVEHYEGLAEYGLAADALERAIELQADPRLPFRLVDLLASDNQLERAMELAENLEGEVYVDLAVGRVLLEQGLPGEALPRLESGLEAWPENAGAHYYAAAAAEQLGDIERAIVGYRAAVRVDPDGSAAATALARLGVQLQ